MNTHILIPIKEWEAQRELYRSKLKETDKAQIAPSHDYYRLQGICANMDSILAHEKQISLTDKIIEEKARDFYWRRNPNKIIAENLRPDMVIGYYQALKDLL